MWLNWLFRLAIFFGSNENSESERQQQTDYSEQCCNLLNFFIYIQEMEDCLFGQKASHQVIMWSIIY